MAFDTLKTILVDPTILVIFQFYSRNRCVQDWLGCSLCECQDGESPRPIAYARSLQIHEQNDCIIELEALGMV